MERVTRGICYFWYSHDGGCLRKWHLRKVRGSCRHLECSRQRERRCGSSEAGRNVLDRSQQQRGWCGHSRACCRQEGPRGRKKIFCSGISWISIAKTWQINLLGCFLKSMYPAVGQGGARARLPSSWSFWYVPSLSGVLAVRANCHFCSLASQAYSVVRWKPFVCLLQVPGRVFSWCLVWSQLCYQQVGC